MNRVLKPCEVTGKLGDIFSKPSMPFYSLDVSVPDILVKNSQKKLGTVNLNYCISIKPSLPYFLSKSCAPTTQGSPSGTRGTLERVGSRVVSMK